MMTEQKPSERQELEQLLDWLCERRPRILEAFVIAAASPCRGCGTTIDQDHTPNCEYGKRVAAILDLFDRAVENAAYVQSMREMGGCLTSGKNWSSCWVR